MLINFVLNQLRLCLAIYRSDSSAVLFFGTTAYVVPIVAARLMGKSVFVLPRGHLANSLYLQWRYHHHELTARFFSRVVWLIERVSFRAASEVLTYTRGMASALGLDESDVYTDAARFVDTGRFDSATEWRDRDPLVLFVGRFNAEKNVELLAEAAANLPGGVTARFIGDGPDFDEIETRFGDDIELPGWVSHDELPQHYTDARLLVMCSEETEGLPTVILEAFACGTPAIAYPVNGVGDVVIDGLTGWLLDERDADHIERTIIDRIDGRHGQRVSENCRHAAERRFSFGAAVERYRTLFTKHGLLTAAPEYAAAPGEDLPTDGQVIAGE